MKDFKSELDRKKPHLPNKFFYKLLTIIASSLAHKNGELRYNYHFDKKKLKDEQIVFLSDHASTESYLYALTGYSERQFNIVIGKHHFFKRFMFFILNACGAVPISLFEPDYKCARKLLKLISMGADICLFPEGVQSLDGCVEPIDPATPKFLKKAGLTVVLCKSHGSHLVFPKYNEVHRKGYQAFDYEILFTKEELNNLDIDSINKRLSERLYYDDFEWNKEHRYKYYCNDGNATGLENLLFKCPACKQEFKMHGNGKIFRCECGNEIIVDDYYTLIPKNNSIMPYETISEWNKNQRIAIREEVSDPDFSIEYNCELYELNSEKLSSDNKIHTGFGKIKINQNGIYYTGTRHGKSVELDFDIKKMRTFLSMPDIGNEIFYNGEFFVFKDVDDIKRSIKYQFIVEELHKRRT